MKTAVILMKPKQYTDYSSDAAAPGILYLVATPIGNLGDITARAAQTLSDVDFIAAEDTRVTRKLLEHLKIKKPVVSYHAHNRESSGEIIITRILAGDNCALVTDAGTPGISDPGEDLVRQCIEAGLDIYLIPGPCAAVAALAASGLPTGRFTFEGFLSTATKSRFEHLRDLKSEKRTMVFYEAPHKLLRTLRDMVTVFGNRRISISRELTKMFEETLRMTLEDAIRHFENAPPRGEFTLVIEGAEPDAPPESGLEDAITAARALINEGFSVKDAVKQISDKSGVPKNALYNAIVR